MINVDRPFANNDLKGFKVFHWIGKDVFNWVYWYISGWIARNKLCVFAQKLRKKHLFIPGIGGKLAVRDNDFNNVCVSKSRRRHTFPDSPAERPLTFPRNWIVC